MKVSAIQIVQFGFPLLSSLNVGGQTLRRLEIYNVKSTVEIDVSGKDMAVNVSRTFEKPPWGQWFKNLFSSASNLEEDVIVFGNSEAMIEINNLMHGCIEF